MFSYNPYLFGGVQDAWNEKTVDVIEDDLLYYGGGINSKEKAAEMAKYADTIVVGNAVYDNGAAVLRETVRAVK